MAGKTIAGLLQVLQATDITDGSDILVGVSDVSAAEQSKQFPLDQQGIHFAGVGLQADPNGRISYDFGSLATNPSPDAADTLLLRNQSSGLYNQVSVSNLLAQTNPTNLDVASQTATSLQITSSTGDPATLLVATATLAGLFSAADFNKLLGIAPNANNYIHPTHGGVLVPQGAGDGDYDLAADSVGSSQLIADSVDATAMAANAITAANGALADGSVTEPKLQNNACVTRVYTNASVTLIKLAPDAITTLAIEPSPADPATIEIIVSTDPGNNLVLPAATTSTPGVITEQRVIDLSGSGTGTSIGLDSPRFDHGLTSVSTDINWFANGNHQTVDLDLASTSLTMTNPTLEQYVTLLVRQDLTGGRLIDWSGIPLATGEPIINTAPSANTHIKLYWDGAQYHVVS